MDQDGWIVELSPGPKPHALTLPPGFKDVRAVLVDLPVGMRSVSRFESGLSGEWCYFAVGDTVMMHPPNEVAGQSVVCYWTVSSTGQVARAAVGDRGFALFGQHAELAIEPEAVGFQEWPADGWIGLEVSIVSEITGKARNVPVRTAIFAKLDSKPFGVFTIPEQVDGTVAIRANGGFVKHPLREILRAGK